MFWLFLPTLAAAGFFSDHVEKYLNHEIDPCDDFYDHVCSSAVAEEHLLSVEAPKQYKNILHQLASPVITGFRNSTVDGFTKFPSMPLSEEEKKVLHWHQQHCLDLNIQWPDDQFLKDAEEYHADYRLRCTPHYNILKKKITDIFEFLKGIITEEFAQAPWTKNHPLLIHSVANVILVDTAYEPTEFQENLEGWVKFIKVDYDYCLKQSTNVSREFATRCLIESTCMHKDGPLGMEIRNYTSFIKHSIAHYNLTENTIRFSPLLYTLEEDDLPYMLGSLDVVISHEIARVVFRNGGAIPSNSECFRRHMQNTCDKYLDKDECSVYNKNFGDLPAAENGNYSRFGNDASDWIGMYASLKALEKYFPESFAENSPSVNVSKRIEILRKFFYAYGINLCSKSPKKGDPSHSPNKVRSNAIPSMFPEFSEAFQCKRGSNMAKGATCLPFAGVGAPTRKRHGYFRP